MEGHSMKREVIEIQRKYFVIGITFICLYKIIISHSSVLRVINTYLP